ncbi:MAG: hypothetical protein P8Y98_02385 [Anaerolineales bacterium]
MSYIVGIPLLSLLAILQSVLMGYFQLLDGRADLVLVAVVAWSLMLMPLGVMLVASLTYHILSTLVAMILVQDVSFAYTFRRIILPSTFLNVIIALPASQLASALHYRLYPQEVEL